MTPLEEAKQKEKNDGCYICKNRVKVCGSWFCKVSGKFLLPSLMASGHCMHNPSDYERR